MRGMKRTRTVGTTRKAGVGQTELTTSQRALLNIMRTFDGEFTLNDVAIKTGFPVQRYGVTMRALCRMGLVKQTYRSPSSRKPNEYRRIKS